MITAFEKEIREFAKTVPMKDITNESFQRRLNEPSQPSGGNNMTPEQEIHAKLESYYMPFFEGDRKRLCITNDIFENMKPPLYYMQVNKKEIYFKLKKKEGESLIIYDFATKSLLKNDIKQDFVFLKKFLGLLDKVSDDVRDKKAQVFEETNNSDQK